MEWQRSEHGKQLYNFQQIKERGHQLKAQIRNVLEQHSDAISAKEESKPSNISRNQKIKFSIYLEIEKLRRVPNQTKGRNRHLYFVGKCPFQSFKTDAVAINSIYHHHWIESLPLMLSNQEIESMDRGVLILELWDKSELSEDFIGMIKLPLHPYFLAYRTPNSSCYHSHYPVVSVREFVELEHPLHAHEQRGETLILLAMGTFDQVQTFATHQRACRVLQNAYRKYRSRQLSDSKKKLKSLSVFLAKDRPSYSIQMKQKESLVEFEVSITTLSNLTKELKK